MAYTESASQWKDWCDFDYRGQWIWPIPISLLSLLHCSGLIEWRLALEEMRQARRARAPVEDCDWEGQVEK